MQPVRGGEREAQHHRAPGRRRNRARSGSRTISRAKAVGDDEPGFPGMISAGMSSGMAK